MAHGHSRFVLATAGGQAVILGREVGVPGTAGCLSGLDQGYPQSTGPLAGLATMAFARALVVARTHPRPGCHVARSREAAKVSPHFGDDHLGYPLPHSGDDVQPGD